uniref:Uncharacterized protein n=1 Tax=Anguilla anguilla TaxID=7936 RepID=A0A0E9R3W8_ANGAN
MSSCCVFGYPISQLALVSTMARSVAYWVRLELLCYGMVCDRQRNAIAILITGT